MRGRLAPVSPCYGAITGRNFIFGPFLADLLEIISFIVNMIVAILPVIPEQGGVLEVTGRAVGNNREEHCRNRVLDRHDACGGEDADSG